MTGWQALRTLLDAAPAAVVVITPAASGGVDDANAEAVAYANAEAEAVFGALDPGAAVSELDAAEPGDGSFVAAVSAAGEGRTVTLRDVPTRHGRVRATVGPWPDHRGAAPGGGGLDVPVEAVLVVAVRCDRAASSETLARRERRRRTSEQVAHLQRAASALASALTEHRVLQIVAATGRTLGASSSVVGFVEKVNGREVLRFPAFTGHDTPLAAMFGDLDLDVDTPSCIAARTAEPFFLSSPDDVLRLMTSDVTRMFLARTEERSWAMLPLVVHGRALGVLRCGWLEERSFPEDERSALLLLAGQAAAAIERARLMARQQVASAALEYSELRYRTLAESVALDVFSADRSGRFTTDMPHWRALTGREQPTLGLTWLDDVHPDDRVRVRDRWTDAVRAARPYEVELRLRAARGVERVLLLRAVPIVDDTDEEAVLEWIGTSEDVTEQRAVARRAVALQRATAALAGALTVAQVVTVTTAVARDTVGAREATVVLLDATGTTLEPTVDGPCTAPPEHQQLTARAVANHEPLFVAADDQDPFTARAVLPLATTGAPVGALELAFPPAQEFPAAQRDFLLALAGQCAQALERAQLYARQQSTAQILQRALLPDRLPRVPGLTVAARYQAAGGSDVGGDWYDVVDVGGGGVAVVLGDVVGRGVRAASVMGQVRAAVRAYVAQDPSPAHVLGGLDRLFAVFAADELVTLFYAVVSSDGTVTYANAGHLPPFVVRGDGLVEPLSSAGSPPLGVEPVTRPVRRTRLLPGDLLCVYSDGVVEHRERSLDDGMDRLRAALGRLVGTRSDGAPGAPGAPGATSPDDPADVERMVELEPLADRILAELVEGDSADDDASLLLVRVGGDTRPELPGAPFGSWRLPPDRTSGPVGRRHLREQCARWRLAHGVETAELLAGELLANAIVHAGTPMELSVELRPGILHVSVGDEDARRPVPFDAGPATTGGRGLTLVQALADRWGVDRDGHEPGKRVWFEVPVD